MTAWATALVPLVVALVSVARWPTLAKRIRDHTALAKDLPPEAAKELQSLLVDEVRRLAEKDRRRPSRSDPLHLVPGQATLVLKAADPKISVRPGQAAGLSVTA